MKIVFCGTMGRFPIGGHAWTQLQYLAGFAALGHEILYLEDAGEESWVYDWDAEALTTSLDYPAAFVASCLEPLGLGGRWIYRAGEESRGVSVEELRAFCAEADLLLIRAAPLAVWRPEYRLPRRRAYVDVDPGFIQIDLVNGHAQLNETVARCERLFTIARRFGRPDCPVPDAGREWISTVSPVALDHWPAAEGAATHFTTVMQWRGFREVTHEGVRYGQKDLEFAHFLDLPRRTAQPIRLALSGTPPERLEAHGWEVVEGWTASRTTDLYRAFIQGSRGEISVAKHGYVKMRAGWFSDRSACYLASGRPVAVQDTGLADWLPVGRGLLTFRDVEGAAAAIERINGDYEAHRRAARHIAEAHFATDRVLPPLLEAALA